MCPQPCSTSVRHPRATSRGGFTRRSSSAQASVTGTRICSTPEKTAARIAMLAPLEARRGDVGAHQPRRRRRRHPLRMADRRAQQQLPPAPGAQQQSAAAAAPRGRSGARRRPRRGPSGRIQSPAVHRVRRPTAPAPPWPARAPPSRRASCPPRARARSRARSRKAATEPASTCGVGCAPFDSGADPPKPGRSTAITSRSRASSARAAAPTRPARRRADG